MEKTYCCDIDYKIISLRDNITVAEKKMNELAAQGYKIHSQNYGIIIMMKESYSEKETPKYKKKDTFYGYDVEITNMTPNDCEANLYIPATLPFSRYEFLKEKLEEYLRTKYNVIPFVNFVCEDEMTTINNTFAANYRC